VPDLYLIERHVGIGFVDKPRRYQEERPLDNRAALRSSETSFEPACVDGRKLGVSGPLLRMADMSPFWVCTFFK